MNLFDEIYNDQEIRNRYHEVEVFEEKDGGWTYHNFYHVLNVTKNVEIILKALGYDDEFIENAKIAAIMHDTGCTLGKDNHAERSYLFAIDYFKRKNIHLKYEDMVLEAIKIHSNGFDTDNEMALAIILLDKLDFKKERITKAGLKVSGNRQYGHINDIKIKLEGKKLIVNFLTDDKIDLKEMEDYYFTVKIFKAIKAFCDKMNLDNEVLINDHKWEKFYV